MTAATNPESAGPSPGEIAARLDRLQQALETICVRLAALGRPDATTFTTGEFAALTGLAAYTVRDHLKTGRIEGTRDPGGRGWRIPRAELDRYEREGLRPAVRPRGRSAAPLGPGVPSGGSGPGRPSNRTREGET